MQLVVLTLLIGNTLTECQRSSLTDDAGRDQHRHGVVADLTQILAGSRLDLGGIWKDVHPEKIFLAYSFNHSKEDCLKRAQEKGLGGQVRDVPQSDRDAGESISRGDIARRRFDKFNLNVEVQVDVRMIGMFLEISKCQLIHRVRIQCHLFGRWLGETRLRSLTI